MIRVAEFISGWTDEDLETVWTLSGMAGALGGDPDAPFPGREIFGTVMPKFLEIIPTPLRDLLRRAVRIMHIRRQMTELRALLRRILLHLEETPFVLSVPEPVVLDSQLHRTAITPTRGSPRGIRIGWAPT